MTDAEIFSLCDVVRECAFSAHRFLRHGHLEKVYEQSLANRLRQKGISVVQQHPLQVLDEDGSVLGDYFADLLVQSELIVELKACRQLADEHTAQVLGYLRACRLHHALLINFGGPTLQLKKYVLSDPT